MIVSLVCPLFADATAVRGERARRVASALRAEGDDVLVLPRVNEWRRRNTPAKALKALNKAASPFVLDRVELETAMTPLAKQVSGDVALLVGYPFSAVYQGARACKARDIPYIVDVGDPWVLTNQVQPRFPLVRRRSVAAETFVWSHASGGIVTTRRQADAIRALFPTLPMLVRPNGAIPGPATLQVSDPLPGVLRLVHYGALYSVRLDLISLLQPICASRCWDVVRLTLYGSVEKEILASMKRLTNLEVEVRSFAPWSELLESCGEFDGAIVVGNADPGQLPSKAIAYQSLGIPRVALVGSVQGSALEEFADQRPGWFVLRREGNVRNLAKFLTNRQVTTELPPGDSWSEVADSIVRFVKSVKTEGQ